MTVCTPWPISTDPEITAMLPSFEYFDVCMSGFFGSAAVLERTGKPFAAFDAAWSIRLILFSPSDRVGNLRECPF